MKKSLEMPLPKKSAPIKTTQNHPPSY